MQEQIALFHVGVAIGQELAWIQMQEQVVLSHVGVATGHGDG